MESQINKLIENLDNRRLFFKDFDVKDEIKEKILASLSENNLLGKGAVGKVYLIDKYAVKEISPCESDKKSALYKYCLDILTARENYEIQKIPGGNGKHRYILPNLFSEILIGMILGGNVFFTSTLNSFIEDNNIYIIMDSHNPIIKDKQLNLEMSNPKNFLYLLFQVSYGIMIAQEKFRFTHYDLHIENILWDKLDMDISFPLPNTNKRLLISKENCPFLCKISDFALARMETKRTLITPSIDNYPVKSYGEFHPSYDILSFLGSILIDNKYREYFTQIFKNNLDLYRFMLLLIIWILNDKEIQVRKGSQYEELEKIRDLIGDKYYTSIGKVKNKFIFRPKQEGDFIKYSSSKSMVTIVDFLGKMIELKKYGKLSNRRGKDILRLKELNKYKKYGDVLKYIPDIPINEIPDRKESLGNYKEMKIDDFIKVRTYHFLANIVPKSFNFTIEKEQLAKCPIQEHYLTTIFVKKGYEKKYKFGLDCCKLDPANYLLNSNKTGFTINGSFFAIKSDFLPIGLYEDSTSFINKYKVPQKYRDSYRYILIKNNKITISKNPELGEQIFMSGPILIENGEIVFNPQENRFECNDEKNAGDTFLEMDENTITTSGYYKYNSIETDNGFSCVKEFVPDIKTYPRCDKINPGELSHADNPNPRSVLCILKNGDYIFITVEGRAKRGIGFDLYSLSQTILKSFPNVIQAINLDGGRSSNMAWRSVEEPDKIYISNPDHVYPYPVGNILTLTDF